MNPFALLAMCWWPCKGPNVVISFIAYWNDNRDVAGQERFGNLTRVFYKGAAGGFIVFDVTRNSSFKGVAKWKQDIDQVRTTYTLMLLLSPSPTMHVTLLS
jgi:hypothetical protein